MRLNGKFTDECNSLIVYFGNRRALDEFNGKRIVTIFDSRLTMAQFLLHFVEAVENR